ncbi:MAG: PHP domain-containing protein [Porticoccaceae bacterium]
MNVDLHCHTDRSDGSLPPEKLIALAIDRKIDILAITDHDNIDCYKEISDSTGDLTLITGVEFSTVWRNIGVHIVGLNMDLNNAELLKGIEFQSAAREKRAELIDQKLYNLGFKGCLDGAKRISKGSQVGRPHFAQHLVEIGAVSNIQQAFKRYLGAGKAGDIKQQWASLGEVISWIRGAGGVAVLAHPTKYKMTRTKLCLLLEDFIALGGEAMEVISGTQTVSETQSMARLCKQYNLLASRGSDFHSPGQPWAALGMASELPIDCKPVWSRWTE